jgi:hypothetical protein
VRFEQAVDHVGGEQDRAGLPRRERVRSTAWFHEYKSPVVACRLVARSATGVRFESDEGEPVFSVYYDEDRGVVSFDGEHRIEIAVDAVDVSLEMSDTVVGYRRTREGRGIRWESSGPWED